MRAILGKKKVKYDMLITGQATRSQGLNSVIVCLCFVPTPWPLYSCKTVATYKNMMVLICGVFTNNFLFWEEREKAEL